MKRFGIHQTVVVVFFALYFILGAEIVRDYGLSWDEPYLRKTGMMAYRFMTRRDDMLMRYVDRDYGTAFELPLVVIEKILSVKSPQQVYFMRHFLTFLFFFTGAVFFYLIGRERFQHRQMALLGVLFLLLSPRIFSDSFYNSKDIGLLSGFILAVYSLMYFLKNPTGKRGFLHAAVSAFVIDIRLAGLMIIGLTIVFWFLDIFFRRPNRKFLLSDGTGILVYVVFIPVFVIAFWPYLWSDPLGHFFHAFRTMGNYVFGVTTVLYFGNRINVSAIPWHYPLVWIGMTTPVVFTLLFLVGFGIVIKRYVSNFRHAYARYHNDIIMLLWFVVPIFTVIALGTPLYDGWRHLYFIYPAFIMVGLIGLEHIWSWSKTYTSQRLLQSVVAILLMGDLTGVLLFMVRTHPYQNIYYNALVGGMAVAKRNFVLDYWGLTFRKGLEYIASHDARREITVYFDQGNQDSVDMLPDTDRVRLIPLQLPQEADYILTNYPDISEEYDAGSPSGYDEVYNVIIDNTKIMTVFKKN